MKKILVVEDDFDIGEIVKMLLSSKYDVLLKQDSKQLLDVIKHFKPQLIIMDNFIGKKNAKEMLEEINTDGFSLNVPVILFTAHPDIKEIAIEIGAADFIAKPFDLYDFENCINRVITAD